MSSGGSNDDRKGRRERLGQKLKEAKGYMRLSRSRGSVVPGSESPGPDSPRSNEGSGHSSLNSPSNVEPFTLLLLYSRTDNADGLKELLERKKELVAEKDYDQRSALHIAAIHNCLKAAQVLLDYGADVNAQDRWKNSKLRTKVIKKLFFDGPPRGRGLNDGLVAVGTPLADAKSSGHENMVKLLQEAGGMLLGFHGHEVQALAPPTLRKSDWEIDPAEIDLEHSEKIGKGSFGEIKLTHWRGTPVAVKTILPALSDDKLVVLDFRHEVELLIKVRHPNIVQFLGAVTKRPPLMLITEYLSGGDLHIVMKHMSPLPMTTIVSYALDIARGMAYLHNGPNMIIHRDLKPRNILVGENSQLKVGDFGLSKLIKAKNMYDIYHMTGETGSYRYMAPEVFEHKPYDKMVDVYSFGVILYEMFEDTPPFAQYDAYEAARKVAKEKCRPEFKSKYITEDMIKLIQHCWQQDPADRPEFQDVIKELESIKKSIVCPKEHHHLWPFPTTHSTPNPSV